MNTSSRMKLKTTVLAFGLMICSAFAEEATVKGVSWQYSVVDGTARIELLNQVCTGKLAIPAKIGKYRVTSVGGGKNPITCSPGPTSITIPASVTSLGTFAFGGNMNLVEISLPAQLANLP